MIVQRSKISSGRDAQMSGKSCGVRGARYARSLALALVAAALAATLAAVLEGCGASSKGANLILISIDTLRADRLGVYGYPRPTSPAIDALAARGALFTHAMAESSWTLPSHCTLFTGLHPGSHGVINAMIRLPSAVRTLPETLHAHGYRTFGWAGGINLNRRYGFDRGFEVYQSLRRYDLKHNLAEARAHIASLNDDERYFVFVHTYDVHCPLHPPERFARMFRTVMPKNPDQLTKICPHNLDAKKRLTSDQVTYVSNLYDASIRAVDEQLGEFFDWLTERGEWKETVVVLLSDHGEEFREHGKLGHGPRLYVEVLHIPLIIVAPGVKPQIIDNAAGLKDVMPTLLEMMDVPGPVTEGASLAPVLEGETHAGGERPLFSETDFNDNSARAVIQGGLHLIDDSVSGERMLFDLEADPSEKHDRAGEDPADAGRLQEVLTSHRASLKHFKPERARNPTLEERRRLQALGYVR